LQAYSTHRRNKNSYKMFSGKYYGIETTWGDLVANGWGM
jgi:hypothetical protein